VHRILLVEDEDLLREAYHHILSTEPYDIDIAANGKAALELCKQHAYDLILLDLMMPVVDGVGFLQKYSKTNKTNTRIIILSNLSSGAELNKAMSLGAHKSVIKAELSPRQLLSTIRYEVEAI
jgi:two-component system copper resistance phosphate regulon response regulator CusR